ncbi:hypothetical protein EV360DRAFT_71415 [Lentinula raphanica]|nr:hypothetical protein EV360DRAFT_71415 [Lentinula raphanica]
MPASQQFSTSQSTQRRKVGHFDSYSKQKENAYTQLPVLWQQRSPLGPVHVKNKMRLYYGLESLRNSCHSTNKGVQKNGGEDGRNSKFKQHSQGRNIGYVLETWVSNGGVSFALPGYHPDRPRLNFNNLSFSYQYVASNGFWVKASSPEPPTPLLLTHSLARQTPKFTKVATPLQLNIYVPHSLHPYQSGQGPFLGTQEL